ncbi:hypothetical protein [Propioniciclava sp.]|uniref:hypothetical protein n=1 Tax=Propioniciclava sp. TaxID=2038686 RepID=UPI002620AB3A|nr:hypothetical protein [Propioniciclava sp.]
MTQAVPRPDDAELQHLREALAAKGGHTMVRSEVLGWQRSWSAADRQVLERHLTRVGAARFRRSADDGYIRCVDAQDRTAMVIAPGYVMFPRHWVNSECSPDWPGVTLSTFGRRPAAPSTNRTPPARTVRQPRRVEEEPKFCPRCFLQLTPSGTCGNCD